MQAIVLRERERFIVGISVVHDDVVVETIEALKNADKKNKFNVVSIGIDTSDDLVALITRENRS